MFVALALIGCDGAKDVCGTHETEYKPSQCDALSKARAALQGVEQTEVSTLVLVWTNVSVKVCQETPPVCICDQSLGSTEDRPCHQPISSRTVR